MPSVTPELLSAALFEREGRVLTARRRPDRPPFAGLWLVPLDRVRGDETAEETVRRYAREQFGVSVAEETFVDTVYLDDPRGEKFITNLFRAGMAAGPVRFRSDGDYDDARWLAARELEAVEMPAPLRESVSRALAEDFAPLESDWSSFAAAGEEPAPPQATPLGETPVAAAAAGAPAPDNRAAWDAVSKKYQRERYGERFGERLMWSWRTSEDDVRLLDDVRGRRVLVLGCGGGQDLLALDRLGAVAVGIDQSKEQLAYARDYLARHDVPNASVVEGNVEDLSRFDDASFDAVVAAHMLSYVERIERTIAEVGRVLTPGGAFCASVRHPMDAALTWDAPYRIRAPYWDVVQDWEWEGEDGAPVRFRQWLWTVEEWFTMLTSAGLTVERLLEPREDKPIADDQVDDARARLIPATLLFKARKR
jgi:ubiquinone/menaquinone biosynthesis C-methylase UbiE/ADP-ribose pyrophosphatase YjhB (NUDIX family)